MVSGSEGFIRSARKAQPMKLGRVIRPRRRHRLSIAVVCWAAVFVIAGVIRHAPPRGLRRLVDLSSCVASTFWRSGPFSVLRAAQVSRGFVRCGLAAGLAPLSELKPFGLLACAVAVCAVSACGVSACGVTV